MYLSSLAHRVMLIAAEHNVQAGKAGLFIGFWGKRKSTCLSSNFNVLA